MRGSGRLTQHSTHLAAEVGSTDVTKGSLRGLGNVKMDKHLLGFLNISAKLAFAASVWRTSRTKCGFDPSG